MKNFIFILFVSICLSGCVTSSKYTVKVVDGVDANAHNHSFLVDALSANGTLSEPVASALKTNAANTVEYTLSLKEESPSAFNWSSFKGIIDGLIGISGVIGTYFGLPPGTIEKGIGLLTIIGGYFGHKGIVRRKEKKGKILARMNPNTVKEYDDIEKQLDEEEKAKKVKDKA